MSFHNTVVCSLPYYFRSSRRWRAPASRSREGTKVYAGTRQAVHLSGDACSNARSVATEYNVTPRRAISNRGLIFQSQNTIPHPASTTGNSVLRSIALLVAALIHASTALYASTALPRAGNRSARALVSFSASDLSHQHKIKPVVRVAQRIIFYSRRGSQVALCSRIFSTKAEFIGGFRREEVIYSAKVEL
jgi:hypothetical protein